MVDQAQSSITIASDKATIMNVIADFPAYPDWAGFIKSAEVVEPGEDGRAKQVRFVLDAGVIKDDYVLEYDWSGDDEVSWHLVKGKVLKGMDGTSAPPHGGSGQTKAAYRPAVDLNLPMIGLLKRRAE